MPSIDRTTYQKARRPIGSGYDRRPKGLGPSSIIVHSTNGRRGSALDSEARFLVGSDGVGAHYLIGKGGQIIELLDPLWRAWHGGMTVPAFLNSRSIGIELHHTAGETWTSLQRAALTWLVSSVLMPTYTIDISLIDTHRAVALPRGRKSDPSDWSDRDFYAWRASLAGQHYVPLITHLPSYVVTTDANVRQGAARRFPVALDGRCVLGKGFTFEGDVVVKGEAIGGNDQWIHVASPAPWGFVHSSCVRAI